LVGLEELITVSQFITDLCLNELERRGELQFVGGQASIPYQCDYMLDTVLTRGHV